MEKLTISEEEYKVFQIIKQHPDELGFVLQADDYKAYIASYTDIGASIEDVELTEEEFDTIKSYFLK